MICAFLREKTEKGAFFLLKNITVPLFDDRGTVALGTYTPCGGFGSRPLFDDRGTVGK